MIAVDTNVISALLRGEPCELSDGELSHGELYVPFVVIAELRAGIAAGNNPQKNQPLLDRFFDDENLTTSPGLTPEVIQCYTQIYSYLRKKGNPISPNDLWIAAECMQLSLPLMTYDGDFDNVPQIILIK